ncbi:MAG: decarboxylating 6-phosphogluconate dehydrogenase, partial [Dehalococcoidia bacterium]
ALRLVSKGHRVVTYDVSQSAITSAVGQGLEVVKDYKEMLENIDCPRNIWMMIPAGKAVDDVIFNDLLPYLVEGDLLIDGGNSNYKDSIKRAQKLAARKIEFMDVGTSGGICGVHNGLSLMIGGSKDNFKRIEPALKDLAAEKGYHLMGGNGAGHFVKMVHNGIEYTLLQSYAEGFELLREGPFELDLRAIASVWNNGGIVRSWLLGLIQEILEKDKLDIIDAEVGGGQTGSWAVEAAMEAEVPFTMLAAALSNRFHSRRDSFAAKLVAALRMRFGGHTVKRKR